jgi:hypothetical protein
MPTIGYTRFSLTFCSRPQGLMPNAVDPLARQNIAAGQRHLLYHPLSIRRLARRSMCVKKRKNKGLKQLLKDTSRRKQIHQQRAHTHIIPQNLYYSFTRRGLTSNTLHSPIFMARSINTFENDALVCVWGQAHANNHN